jgi:gliding motility-associated protein GldM
MGLPKEPRQKMINMMYLVLTALLALNVSSEILNAFKTVNNSINTSNRMIDEKNAVTYSSFEAKLKDQQTAAKAAIWAPKANQVKKLAGDMVNYIENLKTQLIKEAGTFEKDGVKEMNADNLDAATRLMDVNGKGPELYNKLGAFRSQVIGVLKPEEFGDNPRFQQELKEEIARLQKTIPIDLTVKASTTGSKLSNDAKGWTQMNFHMTPAIAAMTILSKLQNDIKNSEAQMVDYCHRQIGEVKVVFDQFQAIATSNTTYAMPGDDLEITAGVGAFSAAAKT